MKRAGLFLVLLLAPAGAQAAEVRFVHDCRIARIAIVVRHRPDGIHLRAAYRARDGAVLTQGRCPDQNPPTWGNDAESSVEIVDELGYEVLFTGTSGPHIVEVYTIQGLVDPQVKEGRREVFIP